MFQTGGKFGVIVGPNEAYEVHTNRRKKPKPFKQGFWKGEEVDYLRV